MQHCFLRAILPLVKELVQVADKRLVPSMPCNQSREIMLYVVLPLPACSLVEERILVNKGRVEFRGIKRVHPLPIRIFRRKAGNIFAPQVPHLFRTFKIFLRHILLPQVFSQSANAPVLVCIFQVTGNAVPNPYWQVSQCAVFAQVSPIEPRIR